MENAESAQENLRDSLRTRLEIFLDQPTIEEQGGLASKLKENSQTAKELQGLGMKYDVAGSVVVATIKNLRVIVQDFVIDPIRTSLAKRYYKEKS
jgi:hypothetical protein